MLYLLNGLPAFFGTFNVTGNIIISGQGLFADGSAAAPSISFAADTNTGFFRNGADEIGVSAGGSAQFYFLSAGRLAGANGNNLLTMPSSGSIALTAAGTNQNITLTPSGTGQTGLVGPSYFTGSLNFGGTSAPNGYVWWGATKLILRAGTSYPNLSFEVNGGVEAMRLFSNARVAIGTGGVDSGALFQIGTNTTNSAGGLVFGTDTFLYRSSAGALNLDYASGAATLRIAGSGGSGALQSLGANFLVGASTGGSSLILFSANVTALTLDSAQRTILSGALRLNHAYTAGVGAATGYLTVQDSTGTVYKIPVLV